jgi:hypothetical protein
MTCALLRPVACSVVLLGALIQSPSRLGAQSATQSATQSTTQSATSPAAPQPPRPTPLVLTTTAWPDGGVIPVKYSQAGSSCLPYSAGPTCRQAP